MSNIYARLEKIIPKIREDKFIDGRGLGNEISFYIFDYDPEDELLVRDFTKRILREFNTFDSSRRIIEFDLYKMMLQLAKEQGVFEAIFEMERDTDKDELFAALQDFTEPRIFLNKIKEQLGDHNVILLTGIGKAFPFVRSHTILNNLQEVIDKIPVILFFPGIYDGQTLSIFGKIRDDHYYRAFQLVDRK